MCLGCQKTFNLLDNDFCYNCTKIIRASCQFTADQGGQFQLLKAGPVEFSLACKLGHHWQTNFKSKQVRKWCVVCKDIGKANKKQYFQDLDRQHFEQLFREQNDLLNRERHLEALSDETGSFADNLQDLNVSQSLNELLS